MVEILFSDTEINVNKTMKFETDNITNGVLKLVNDEYFLKFKEFSLKLNKVESGVLSNSNQSVIKYKSPDLNIKDGDTVVSNNKMDRSQINTGLSGGAIAGIVIGAVFAFIVCLGGIVFACKKLND